MRNLTAIAVCLMLVSGVAYAQQMSTPLNVSQSVHDSRWGQCAVGPDSIIHIVWQESYIDDAGSDILYVTYDGTRFSTPFRVKASPNIHAERPHIAVNNNGWIAVVWDQEHYMWCRLYNPDQAAWMPAERISGDMEWPGEEPAVSLDSENNVYVFYYTKEPGFAWARCKINGVWDGPTMLSDPNYRAQHGCIASGPDGTTWAVWIEKGDDGNYACFYSRRTKATGWRHKADINYQGGSQATSGIDIGTDSVPRVVWMQESTLDSGGGILIIVSVLNETTNPTEEAIGPDLQHFPRIALDNNNKPHVATQEGPGDFGGGIKYTNKVNGYWLAPYRFPNSEGHPKLPGIAADDFGNVAVVWDSFVSTPQKEIWLSTLQPVVPKKFLPPVNLVSSINIKGIKGSSEITYSLSWQKNPENIDQYLSGYKLYVKENNGAWALHGTVNASTLTYEAKYTDLSTKRKFGIRTISSGGAQSAIVEF